MEEMHRHASRLRARLASRVESLGDALSLSASQIAAAAAAGEMVLQLGPVPILSRHRTRTVRETSLISAEMDRLAGRCLGAASVSALFEEAARQDCHHKSASNALATQYVPEPLQECFFGTEGAATRLSYWPKGSGGSMADLLKKPTLKASFRQSLSMARPFDANGSSSAEFDLGKHVGK